MVVGAKVCDLTEDLLWFVCGLYVGILMSPLTPSSGCGEGGGGHKNVQTKTSRPLKMFRFSHFVAPPPPSPRSR